MEHTHHNHTADNIGNAFKTGITVNIVFIVLEVIFGLVSNSMALLADAGHNFSDVLALVFSWIAVRLSQRKPTLKFTYGFRRSTILIALLNTMLLLVAVGVIAWETIGRIGKPVHIDSGSIITVAAIGIVVNGFTAWLFMGGKKHDLNIRSAFIHFIADTLVSLGVVITGIIISYTGITWIDWVVSFAIIGVILYSTYHLLVDSVTLSLDAVPENVNIQEVRNFLQEKPEVSGVHDLHIWPMSTTDAALSVHLVTRKQTGIAFIQEIQQQLHQKFDIEHSTIQIEYGAGVNDCDTNCE